MFGKTHSNEQKLKMSENNKGSKNSFFGKKHTEESKNKISIKNKINMSGENNPMYKKSFVDIWRYKYGETITREMLEIKSLKMSEKCKGEKNSFFGRKHTEETKNKIRYTLKTGKHKDVVNSVKYRENMSKATKNKVFSNEHRRKLRLSKINQISKNKFDGNQISPAFNPIGCQILDKMSKETNTYIQHAMNGGELYIKHLGYWVDGYDEKNNIVYEIDEQQHFDISGNLKEKDKNRQNEIKKYLNCTFIRIKFNK